MVNDELDVEEHLVKVWDQLVQNSFGGLQNTKRLVFRTVPGTEIDFFLQETLTVIYDSMQLGELIPNAILVLHRNASIFVKLIILG
jgi:hypothetical protein